MRTGPALTVVCFRWCVEVERHGLHLRDLFAVRMTKRRRKSSAPRWEPGLGRTGEGPRVAGASAGLLAGAKLLLGGGTVEAAELVKQRRGVGAQRKAPVERAAISQGSSMGRRVAPAR